MVDLNIEKIDINELVPADYNPRKISDKDYHNLQNSIDEFGVVDPIIINLKDNTIISGHQRFDVLYYKNKLSELYLIRLGDVGWVFTDTDLKIKDKNHEKALNLALNRIHGEFDEDMLNEVLVELEELHLDHLTGFDLELNNIDYEFVSRIEDTYDDDIYEEEFIDDDDFEDDDIDEPIIENIEKEEKLKQNKVEKPPERIKRGFIKYGDIYKVGDSSYLMFGKHNNGQDRTKLLSIDTKKNTVNMPDDLEKIKTITKEINYYISDDAELIENIIIKNNSICKKIK